ncbi:MAG: transporter substrate-binding domain-containing protein, partial [Gammaproteobacteria bacterium]
MVTLNINPKAPNRSTGVVCGPPLLYTVTLLLLFLLTGCGQEGSESSSGKNGSESAQTGSGSKEQISENAFRVIVRSESVAFLPRNAEPVRIDREIAEGLARELKRPYQPVVIEDYTDMIDHLLARDGDIIAASMTITETRADRVLFSIPYNYVDELLIVPAGAGVAEAWQDLNGKSLCVRRGSSYEETLTRMKQDGVDLKIDIQPEDRDTEEIVDRVASGDCPATLVDSHYWNSIKRHFDNLQSLRALAENRAIALAMRPDDRELKKRVDQYLVKRALTGQRDSLYTDDLPGLKERKRLRMITRNSATTFYLYRGSPYGFEYELVKRFADQHDLRLDIVIPDDNESLIPWLNEGRGDIVAAMLTITPRRLEDAAFTRPYFYDDEVVVARNKDNIENIDDLAGRTIHVRKSSSYYRTVQDLRERVPDINIELAPEDMQTDEILRKVADGEWDLTICNLDLLQVEQTYGGPIKAALTVDDDNKIGWAVRKGNKKLLQALNKFIRKEYRGLFYNMRKERYFENPKTIARAEGEWRMDRGGRISPYDDLVKKYADRHDLDWRLIVSQMYQESRFNPKKQSWAGARGLMQLLPRAAREVGVEGNLYDPENSIKAGVRYLRRMINLLDPKLPMSERIRFGLVSYNAGRGHMLDARRVARRQGLDPDTWYDNTEKAMLMLSQRKYHSKSRFGYVRGSEPVNYVRDIESRYFNYVQHLPGEGKD